MDRINKNHPAAKERKILPDKVIMFGEGAFLRAFACYAIDVMNEMGLFGGGVTVLQPLPEGKINLLAEQDGLYTVIERGVKNGEEVVNTRLITCVNGCINPYENYDGFIKLARNPDLRFFISNTTEAGIAYGDGDALSDRPPNSFPAKVTAFLHERFTCFSGEQSKGLIFLPCELIENNGGALKELVRKYALEWELGGDFLRWLDESCVFANTLVDRIVAGYPSVEADRICEELGFNDELLDACELFYFWAIENMAVKNEFPLDKAGLNAVFSEDIAPYRLRKVRMLNGLHTFLAPVALKRGIKTVGEAVSNKELRELIEKVLFEEIIPALDMDKNELAAYAETILERFENPYIRHELSGIMLNHEAKLKTRIEPTVEEYRRRFGKNPPILEGLLHDSY